MTDVAPRSETDWQSPAPPRSITARRYTDPTYMAAEWDRVWAKAWLVAGLACDVREPGEYFVFNLGTESIVVSCTDENEIVTHYNRSVDPSTDGLVAYWNLDDSGGQ